jgi:superfamily II DNA or RNA helicase
MKKLREYQNKAINEIAYKSSLGKKRICLQLATGGGKTICFAGLINRFLAKRPNDKVI